MADIFFEIHADNPREGPGDYASTRRAFLALKNLPGKPAILDIGCGPGKQTLDLAQLTQGSITAVDNHQPYLTRLDKMVISRRLQKRVRTVKADMFSLNFAPGSFDIIWSEGAIYIIGFEQGLVAWKKFLKLKGYIVVSELTRLKANPPQEAKEFWEGAYPAMHDTAGNLAIIARAGYSLVEHFTLPESAWLEEYYGPLQAKVEKLKPKYKNDPAALKVLAAEDFERNSYQKYSAYYGYVFYIMKQAG
ncbi:MAG: class I SAM-dependent methyltransferase [bacterium]|nr:class I SAM-dependent methyltransferase [bacterium]MDD5354180.1 class I SAM-dependent methyltransferase [bacterium]MDD5757222.1 class I SAM-dependent methyltransferase [bacterium]